MTVENEKTSPKFGNSLLNLTHMPVGAASKTTLNLAPFTTDPNGAKLRNQRLVIVIVFVIVIFSASFDYD